MLRASVFEMNHACTGRDPSSAPIARAYFHLFWRRRTANTLHFHSSWHRLARDGIGYR